MLNRREELITAVKKVGVPEAVRRIKSVVQETRLAPDRAGGPMTIPVMLRTLHRVANELIEKLGCADAATFDVTCVISHWQGNGFRLQITRRSDGKSLTRFIREDGTVLP